MWWKFPCSLCCRNFAYKHNLQKHVENIHNKIVCQQCCDIFGTKEDMRSHLLSHLRLPQDNIQAPPIKKMKIDDSNEEGGVSVGEPSPGPSGELGEQPNLDNTQRGGGDPSLILDSPINLDPVLFPSELRETLKDNTELLTVVRNNWGSIKTCFHLRPKRIQDYYNFRYPVERGELLKMFRRQNTACKIQVSFGLILRHVESGRLKYFHSCQNNSRLFEQPLFISTEKQFIEMLDKMTALDMEEKGKTNRPDTKWNLHSISNISFYVNRLPHVPLLGKAPVVMPSFLSKNKGLVVLTRERGGKGALYKDNLCVFRCLAYSRGIRGESIDTKAVDYCIEFGCSPRNFQGISLQELNIFEDKFQVRVTVYSLKECEGQNQSKQKQTCVLIRRSHKSYKEKLNVNMYENHMSYIERFDIYSKSYSCTNCNKSFCRKWDLERHVKSCDTNVKYIFPGGTYHVERPIFDLLSEEGVRVPSIEKQKYPFRAVFDYETYIDEVSAKLPTSSEKTTWTGLHVPVSVGIHSNIPNFNECVCFIASESDPSPQSLVDKMIHHLESMSCHAKKLLLCLLSETFDDINKLIASEQEHILNIGSQQCGHKEVGDMTGWGNERVNKDMTPPDATDMHTTEEVEGQYIPDKESENVKQQCKYYEKRRFIYLRSLKSRLEKWINQLPVIGFNSGKYDLNLILEYLVKNFKSRENDENKGGFEGADGCDDDNGDEESLDIDCGEGENVKMKLSTVKRNNGFICLSTGRLVFLDISNYLAAGTSYAQYVKAYIHEEGESVEKLYFPYEYLKSISVLNETKLPPHSAFFSSLKDSNISDEEYKFCQTVWEREGMQTIGDMLVYYNKMDCIPFIKALDNHFDFYWGSMKLDMFKDAMTLPGLTHKFLMSKTDATFSVFNNGNKDVYNTLRKNVVGGPSVVYHRHHAKNKTKIKERIFREKSELTKVIMGYDCNSMYLGSTGNLMPTGYMVRRTEPDFKPTSPHRAQLAAEWLSWLEFKNGVKIRHQENGMEKRIGSRMIPVDGYCRETKTIYNFNGCFYHGCEKCMSEQFQPTEPHPFKTPKTWHEVAQESQYVETYLKEQKDFTKVVIIWECEWKFEIEKSKKIRDFLQALRSGVFKSSFLPRGGLLNCHSDSKGTEPPSIPKDYCIPLSGATRSMTEGEVLDLIVNEKMFGLVLCDIHVPENLKTKFREFPPIFKNCDITRDDIGDFMKTFCEENDLMTKPRRALIQSFKGDKILLATPLLKWYLSKGLIVTHVYEIYEWSGQPCFKWFVDYVSESRRAGDKSKDKKILGNTAKLAGNSGYGRLILDKTKHLNVKYCNDSEAERLVNNHLFRQMSEVGDDYYEVQSAKRRVRCDLPLQLVFFVYSYAKLYFVQFVHDFLVEYLDEKTYELCQGDTDGLYIALSKNTLYECVVPGKRRAFLENLRNWLVVDACDKHYTEYVDFMMNNFEGGSIWEPRDCCKARELFDNRKTGLFKMEAKGDEIVCLNSKTYFLADSETSKNKFSSKGLSRKNTNLTLENYKSVLQSYNSVSGVNKSFRIQNHSIFTYHQERNGLSFLYPKRKVLPDGVSTEPLDI
jgi:G:T-mismatch repair DNA endonuclease (very short patch repair protein)